MQVFSKDVAIVNMLNHSRRLHLKVLPLFSFKFHEGGEDFVMQMFCSSELDEFVMLLHLSLAPLRIQHCQPQLFLGFHKRVGSFHEFASFIELEAGLLQAGVDNEPCFGVHHDFGAAESVVDILEGLGGERLEHSVDDLLDEVAPLLASFLIVRHQVVPSLDVGGGEKLEASVEFFVLVPVWKVFLLHADGL